MVGVQILLIPHLCADLVKFKWNGKNPVSLSVPGLQRLVDGTQVTLSWFQFLSSDRLLPNKASRGFCLFSWLRARASRLSHMELIDGCQIHSAEASLWLLSAVQNVISCTLQTAH